MKITRLAHAAALAAAIVLAPGAVTMTASQAQAQQLRFMSCYQLWYARNVIYARRGYCFRTYRARRIFGRRCYPPYGRLQGWERRRVNRITRWEYRKGCR